MSRLLYSISDGFQREEPTMLDDIYSGEAKIVDGEIVYPGQDDE